MDIVISEDVCEADSEVVITTWLVEDGDVVEKGMPICELMAEKAQMEFDAPCAGTIKFIAELEKPLSPGDVIAEIG